ncbi:MAG: thiazole synthase [Kiritimatiellia bacterium]|nr:thiazole synthase [Candidatus Brocadiia bacterium]MDP6630791.1 thiazole synthase [Kiritimatiellia bacterium]MDP6809345.1 thiazole synthase [Kiritimatiellia bacterium]MDP7023977.1 thiazole synthase [Kiritimatiellia bacterium]
MSDTLTLGDLAFSSRLLLGTGKFSDVETMIAAVKASGAEIVTVALRRFNANEAEDDLFGPLSQLDGVTLMPNTSGARNAQEAVRAAMLARELSGSKLVKVEIHPNPHHLMPDPIETYEAAKTLAADGFVVMPYMPADPVLAKRLEDVGCASVMPLGSAIGSGHGLSTRELVGLIIRDSGIPVIIDAGLRAPSEATAAMEMGCDAVLVNSAIANAGDPAAMGRAFADAVATGYAARQAGLMARLDHAEATSPLTAFLSDAE